MRSWSNPRKDFISLEVKMSRRKVKAILFDSGKVLNRPVTGHWFITPDFFNYVDKDIYNSILKHKKRDAFRQAARYITAQKLIETEEDEYIHFLEYYKIFFSMLPELNIGEERIKLIAKDLVYNYNKYEFFNDVKEVLPGLSEIYKLAVISDAWPSLEGVFVNAGMRKYFQSFIISSKIGTSKPDTLMYSTALEELNVSAEEAVFIDDNPRNCDGARSLGIRTILICRDLKHYIINKIICRRHSVIRDVKSIQNMKL